MAYDVRIIPVGEFLRSDVTGVLNREASRQLLSKLMGASRQQNINRILIDCRDASSVTNLTDVWMLVQDFDALGVTRKCRIAVLSSPEGDFGKVEFLEVCASNRGYAVKAFVEFEGAVTWLAAQQSCSESVP